MLQRYGAVLPSLEREMLIRIIKENHPADRYAAWLDRFGGLDLLRLCIARRVYTNNHMDVIAAALKNVYDRRHEIKRGVKIVWETELMRHFTVKLERL